MSNKLLQAQGLGKRFGGLQALSEVSFDIEEGEIYGLIGPNGAGKTTLFNVLTGLYIPEEGSCTFNGVSLSGKKPHEVAYAGLARTFQNIRLFANLSAIENVMIGRHMRTRSGVFGAVLRTRATREGEGAHYRIDGVKHFISNAKEARFLVVFAKTDPDAGARGVSAFVVETDSPGISISSPERLMGIQGAHAFEVAFDSVRVPAANRLGAEGTGFKTAMKVLDNSRLDVAATALGIAEAALADATRWMKERQIGGEPIAGKQGLQWMLADMKLRLEASWGLTLQALALRQAGQPFTLQSAMAKLHASEMAGFVADAALQIHGGYGYTREMPLERYVRDARILRIYEGSSEVQRNIIARTVLAD